jgi:hypothetical protein
MERRKFLIGTGALASGSAAAVGTGAFTSVTADRSFDVTTSSDNDAFLAFETDSSGNGNYASTESNGTVTVDIDSDAGIAGNGTGVNKEATTQINDIFKVRNQGSQAVVVYVDPDSIAESDRTDADSLGIDPQATDRPNGDFTNSGPIAEGVADDQISLTGLYSDPPYEYLGGGDDSTEEFVLEPGEAFDFGLYVNGGSADSDSTINSDLTIVAEAGPVPDSFTGQE